MTHRVPQSFVFSTCQELKVGYEDGTGLSLTQEGERKFVTLRNNFEKIKKMKKTGTGHYKGAFRNSTRVYPKVSGLSR
jgi:hypothetical protein